MKSSIFHSQSLEEELKFVETDEIAGLVVRKYAVPCREFRRFRVAYLFEWVVRSGKMDKDRRNHLKKRIFLGKKTICSCTILCVYLFWKRRRIMECFYCQTGI